VRNTPLSGVVLTSADLDQVMGLLLLREFQPLRIYCTAAVRQALAANDVFRVLDRIPGQSRWVEIVPGENFELISPAGGTIACTPIALAGSLPQYVRERELLPQAGAIIGLLLESAEGVRVGYFPALPDVTEELWHTLDQCDAVFIDGTFWSEDELRRFVPGVPGAREIGHLPVGGPGGTLERLAGLRAPNKIYTHINNTNPMLDEDSPEHAAVRAAGWEIGFDGWQQILQSQLTVSR
jgi:pyrroloquinoline quinone biosynthesis protein B